VSPDQARDLFSEAFEGDLDDERMAAFRALLAEDEDLDAEYQDFVETFESLGQLASPESVQAPNLLPRIQERIRRRSGGRYYRDRFAKRQSGPGFTMPLIAAIAVLVVLGIAFYALQTTVLLEDEAPPTEQAESSSPTDE